MIRHISFYCIIIVVLIGLSSCKPTKTICTYYPKYTIHVDSLRVSDEIIVNNSNNLSCDITSMNYWDEDLKIMLKMDSIITKNPTLILCLTNLRGSLLYLNNSDFTINGSFAFDNRDRTPYIPKNETYCLILNDDFITFDGGEFELKDKRDLGIYYNKASAEFLRKIDVLNESKPQTVTSYVTFLVHYYDDVVKYYTVYLTYEGLKYEITLSKKKYDYYYPIY